MKNVRVAFELYDEDASIDNAIKEIKCKGFQKIDCHIIFDIKMGENFRQKARMVVGGHKTDTLSSLTYFSVVSRDSVRLVFLIAALHDLQILACGIQNAYLTAPCRKKIFTIAGPEFGSDYGKIFIVTRALYQLKSSGAAFRSFLANHLHDIGYRSCKADPNAWIHPAMKPDGFKYWEYILCYVDDILCVSHDPHKTMKLIQNKFKLKDDKMEPPDNYLGATISTMDNIHGD